MRFLVRVDDPDDLLVFEDISKPLFDKRQYALRDKGGSRYFVNDWIMMNEDGNIVEMLLSKTYTPEDMGSILRMIGVHSLAGRGTPAQIVKPTHVKFRDNRRSWLIETATGIEYKAKAA